VEAADLMGEMILRTQLWHHTELVEVVEQGIKALEDPEMLGEILL